MCRLPTGFLRFTLKCVVITVVIFFALVFFVVGWFSLSTLRCIILHKCECICTQPLTSTHILRMKCICEYFGVCILFSGKYVLHFLLIWCCYVCIRLSTSHRPAPAPFHRFTACVCVYVCIHYGISVYMYIFLSNLFFSCFSSNCSAANGKPENAHATHDVRAESKENRADVLQFCCKSKIMDWLAWAKTICGINYKQKQMYREAKKIYTRPGKWQRKTECKQNSHSVYLCLTKCISCGIRNVQTQSFPFRYDKKRRENTWPK